MRSNFKIFTETINYHIISGVLKFFRVFRAIKRAFIHLLTFIPIIIFVLLVILAIYFIGVKLQWYTKGFVAALADLKSIIITVVVTSYFISFVGSERQRKQDLVNQYAIWYDVDTAATEFIIALSRVFNIHKITCYHYIATGDTENQASLENLISIIKQTDFENIPVNWNVRGNYRAGQNKGDYFNCVTQLLFDTFADSSSGRYNNLRKLQRIIYEKYNQLRMHFFPIKDFDWRNLDKAQIKERILLILYSVKDVDAVLSPPWLTNPKLLKLLDRLMKE